MAFLASALRKAKSGGTCGEAVPGAVPYLFSFIPYCKCPSGHAVAGSTPDSRACGSGTRTSFNAGPLKGHGCRCEPVQPCYTVSTQPNFNLEQYISRRWFAQEQMLIRYLPADGQNCVSARYSRQPKLTFWGYSIKVENSGQSDNGQSRGGELCAKSVDQTDAAKLAVAPCWLPSWFDGPYWVLAHNEEEGYALISGGQPTVATPFGCRTGTGTNNAGLWIFTREAQPKSGLVQRVRDIARGKGFDLSVLKPVRHTGCQYPS